MLRTAIRPGTPTPMRPVPASIPRPEYVGKARPAPSTDPWVQSDEIIEKMRVASKIAARALAHAGAAVAPGVTTDHLDQIVHDYICDAGAYPSTLGYRNYPKSCCTSLNEVICHGIPDTTVIQDGDIVNIDVTAYIDGVHGDTNATFLAGNVAEENRLLVERTQESLRRAIKAVAPGRQLNVVGRVIESYAKRFGYGVVRDYTGHGIGRTFHSGTGRAALRRPHGHHRAAEGHDIHHRTDDHPRRYRVGHLGRRLDRHHPRQVLDGPVRTHAGGHRHRCGDPHPAVTPAGLQKKSANTASSNEA